MARKPKLTPLDAIRASEQEQAERERQLAELQKQLQEAGNALKERLKEEAANLVEKYFGGLTSETLELAEEAFKGFCKPCTTVVQGDEAAGEAE